MTTPPSPPGQATPILPGYSGACITNLVPALLDGRDGAEPPEWLPPSAHRAAQVVLLVLDGLGWEQLRARPLLAPTLSAAEGIERPITSVAPTTTATALTSITTGRRPSEHGILGYRIAIGDEILNVLRWTVGSGRAQDARQTVPARELPALHTFAESGGRVPVVSKHEFGGTGFTAAHLGSSPLHGYRVLSSLPLAVGELLEAGQPFVYAYYDGIDKVAHGSGLGDLYDAELRAVDRLVADLVAELPPGAVLLVTADHGQLDVGPNLELLGRELMAAVRFMSGEGRFAGCTRAMVPTRTCVRWRSSATETRPGSLTATSSSTRDGSADRSVTDCSPGSATSHWYRSRPDRLRRSGRHRREPAASRGTVR